MLKATKIKLGFAIVGLLLLAGAGLFVYSRYFDCYDCQGPTRQFIDTQIRSVKEALDQFQRKEGHYPTTDQGLKAVIEKGYWSGDKIEDPWGHAYFYQSPGKDGKAYELHSPSGNEK